jgi:hypothetical protein
MEGREPRSASSIDVADEVGERARRRKKEYPGIEADHLRRIHGN